MVTSVRRLASGEVSVALTGQAELRIVGQMASTVARWSAMDAAQSLFPSSGRRSALMSRPHLLEAPLVPPSSYPTTSVSPTNGWLYNRFPVALYIALATAPKMGGNGGSPSPVGATSLFTKCTSMAFGASAIRIMR
jgi:hypothetical protein